LGGRATSGRLAAEIVEDLEAALAEFSLIAESLGGEATPD